MRDREQSRMSREKKSFWHLDLKEISYVGFYVAALGVLVCLSVLVLVGICWLLLLDINSTERSKGHLYSSLYHHCLA